MANAYFNRTTPSPKATPSVIGRKRSRDDDDDQEVNLVAPVQTPPIDRGEPIYGPGMTLTYPNDLRGHYNMDAGSQSGTWVENTWVDHPKQADAVAVPVSRPEMPSRKSQRLAPSAPTSEDIVAPSESTHRRTASAEPLIDEVTRLLGISWMRMDASEALQISQKAYTKWIRRHYPGLADVELWFENSSIPGYLGVATNKATNMKVFLLWSNDLKQAVLVTRDPNELIAKLMSPQTIISSATESMFACDEPVADNASESGSPTTSFAIPAVVPQTSAAMEVD